jgi:hypothetical protein
MSAPNSKVWTLGDIVHDIQTIIDWCNNNWGFGVNTYIEEPDEIFYNQGQEKDYIANKIRHVWMYKRCIQLLEFDTDFALLDMWGNADANNDTGFQCTVYSKVGFTDAEGMYLRFLQLIRDLAHENNIGVYAFVQITNKAIKRKRWFGRIDANVLLTRRGKGHA